MKKIGEYTMRGRIEADSDSNRILLDDGRFDTGYRVIDFIIASADPNDAAGDTNAKLTTEATTSHAWNWDDGTQIAWAVSENRVTTAPSFGRSIVDPDNLIIQDLFIQCEASNSTSVNYMIIMEKYEITDWQGALGMVRNSSQNV